jgi:CRP-like cAMP-binding protein
MVQAQQTAACNGAHQLEARLATWLLRAHDLTGWIEIPFTQDTISKLLAVKRPSVSMVMAELHRENVVSYTRGNIGLSDRNRLEQRACECFRILRSRRDEVLGPSCSEGSSARRA